MTEKRSLNRHTTVPWVPSQKACFVFHHKSNYCAESSNRVDSVTRLFLSSRGATPSRFLGSGFASGFW